MLRRKGTSGRKKSASSESDSRTCQIHSVMQSVQDMSEDQPFDAFEILRKHTESAKSKTTFHTVDSSGQKVSSSEQSHEKLQNPESGVPVTENINIKSSKFNSSVQTEGTPKHSPKCGIGVRVLKNRLEKRSKDQKLKNSQRLKAIAYSFEVDNRLKSGTQPMKCAKRKSLNSTPSNSTPVHRKKRRTSVSSLPNESEINSLRVTKQTSRTTRHSAELPSLDCASESQSFTASETIVSNSKSKNLGAVPRQSQPNKRHKSDPSGSKKADLKSSSRDKAGDPVPLNSSSNRLNQPPVQEGTNQEEEAGTLPELHTSTLSVDDVVDYRSFEAATSANAVRKKVKLGKMNGRRRKHATSRSVDLPIQISSSKKPRFDRRKSSFDPNVDEDATETDTHPMCGSGRPESALSDNGCLTPSDSDDEDLPNISLNSSQGSSINKGDLVWVKYDRAPFWPAVIMHVYYKKSRLVKLTIVFIGNMGVRDSDPAGTRPWYKKLAISYKSNVVIPFGRKNDDLKQQSYASEFSEALCEAILTCEDYVQERAFGNITDHEEFFAEDIGTAEVRYLQKLEAEGAFDEETLRKVIPQVSQISPSDDEETPEEENESMRDRSEQREKSSQKNMTAADLKRQSWRIDQSQKIVDKMTSQQCYDYLDKIYSGEEKSERHRQFFSANTNKKRHVLAVSHGYGPIMDDHWEHMIVKMAEYTDKKYGKGVLSLSTYLLDVWVPEAIVFAVQRVRKISKEKAEIVFKNGIRSTKSEREESRKAIIKNHKNISQEDQDRYNARNRRFLEETFRV